MKIETQPIAALLPYGNNARTHSPEQVKQIADSITHFGWTNPILIDRHNGVIAGHGRLLAAQALGMDEVPCIRLEDMSDEDRRAYVIADNQLALNAGWDEQMLALELSELREVDFDLGLLGFDAAGIEAALNPAEPKTGLSDDYTQKIDAPIYEPKGHKPPIAELTDTTKSDELLGRIRQSDIPVDIKRFLEQAAQRHVVFDYSKIAEFYCHADKETQELMEDSALVIIDFNKALQHGYAKLKKGVMDALDAQNGEDHEEEN